MTASQGPTIVPYRDPPPWFVLTSTGRCHRVRRVDLVVWPNGPSHQSILFRCGGFAVGDKGFYSNNRPTDGITCTRCEAWANGRHARGRKPAGRSTMNSRERETVVSSSDPAICATSRKSCATDAPDGS